MKMLCLRCVAVCVAVAGLSGAEALAGPGDLVLTDLSAGSARLILGEDLAGRVWVRDRAGRLVAELRKEVAYSVELALGPGTYRVWLENEGGRAEATITLASGRSVLVSTEQLATAAPDPAAARAWAAPSTSSSTAAPIGEATLAGRTQRLGAHAGIAFRYTRLGGGDGLLVAPEAALLLDRRLAVGVLAAGGFSEPRDDRLTIGYAAAFVRYHYLCESQAFCLSLGMAAGAGGAGAGDVADDAIFVFEPQLAGHLNVTRFLRLGADLGYRLVAAADDGAAGDLRGVAAGFQLQVGWF